MGRSYRLHPETGTTLNARVTTSSGNAVSVAKRLAIDDHLGVFSFHDAPAAVTHNAHDEILRKNSTPPSWSHEKSPSRGGAKWITMVNECVRKRRR